MRRFCRRIAEDCDNSSALPTNSASHCLPTIVGQFDSSDQTPKSCFCRAKRPCDAAQWRHARCGPTCGSVFVVCIARSLAGAEFSRPTLRFREVTTEHEAVGISEGECPGHMGRGIA